MQGNQININNLKKPLKYSNNKKRVGSKSNPINVIINVLQEHSISDDRDTAYKSCIKKLTEKISINNRGIRLTTRE